MRLMALCMALVAFGGCAPHSNYTCNIHKGVTHCRELRLRENAPIRLEQYTSTMKLHPPIETIPAGVFAELPQVEALIINFTLMERISSRSFDGLAHLKELNLYWNQLSHLPLRVFSKCPELIYLNLGGNNFETFDSQAFRNLAQLKQLIISSNRVAFMPKLKHLKQLEIFDLGNNKIRRLNDDSFRDFPGLIALNLKGNRINLIEKGAFVGLDRLERLNIEKNQLNILDVADIRTNLPKLVEIRLSINNFSCKVLKEIIEQFARNGIFVPEGLAEPGPISVHGIFCLRDINDTNYV